MRSAAIAKIHILFRHVESRESWLCFCFDFVRSHARCGCCSIVCWREWEWGRGVFKIGRPGSRGWKNVGRRWTGGEGGGGRGLEN